MFNSKLCSATNTDTTDDYILFKNKKNRLCKKKKYQLRKLNYIIPFIIRLDKVLKKKHF